MFLSAFRDKIHFKNKIQIKGSSLLGYDTASTTKYLPTFRRIIAFSSSELNIPTDSFSTKAI